MSNVVPLRSARSSSFYSVRRAGAAWAVVLITPLAEKSLRTTLTYHGTKADAQDYGRKVARVAMLPYKEARQ